MSNDSGSDIRSSWNTVLSNPWVQVLLGLLGIALVCILTYLLSFVLIPLLLAFLVAYIFDPVVDVFERRGVRRGITIVCLAALGVIAILSIPVFAIPSLIEQSNNLRSKALSAAQEPKQTEWMIEGWVEKTLSYLPLNEFVEYTGLREQYEARLAEGEVSRDESAPEEDATTQEETAVPSEDAEPVEEAAESPEAEPQAESEATPDDDTVVDEGITDEAGQADEATGSADEETAAESAEETDTADPAESAPGKDGPEEAPAQVVLADYISLNVKERLESFLMTGGGETSDTGQQAGNTIASFFASVGRGTVGVIVFLGNLALFAFVGGYLLKDYDSVVAEMKKLVPPRWRPAIFRVVGDIDKQMRGFLVGQFTVCICLAILYAIGMIISGVPFALLIAIFGGFASLIPFFGVVLTFLPAATFTLLQYGLDWHIIAVVATFAVVQTLEGNVITPQIMSDRVGLHPVWVILAVMVFGSLLGFTGLLIAVPLAAVLKVLVAESIDYYKQSTIFEEPATEPAQPESVPAKPVRKRRRVKKDAAS